MKKLTYLLLVMFATVLLTTSCEEDDPITPDNPNEGLITLAELDGQWYFESYLYDGIEWDCESNITSDYDNIDGDFVNWYFDTDEMTATNEGACNSGYTWTYEDFSKNNNIIYVFEYEFTVISYENNVLKLRLDATPFNFNYLGGITTFSR